MGFFMILAIILLAILGFFVFAPPFYDLATVDEDCLEDIATKQCGERGLYYINHNAMTSSFACGEDPRSYFIDAKNFKFLDSERKRCRK